MPQASSNWRPSARISRLKRRAEIITAIRGFFAALDYTEVSTPVIAATTSSDPHLASLTLDCMGKKAWLQTSPEQHMKRLLAAGMDACYQIGPAFRADEAGSQHNPEFTLLEWYRPGFNLAELVDECRALIDKLRSEFLDQTGTTIDIASYNEAWNRFLPGNPHLMQTPELLQLLTKQERASLGLLAVDQARDYLFAERIQPYLREPVLIHSFPADSSAMARLAEETTLRGQEYQVAARVELYWKGLEILNGYHELLDAGELQQRHTRDCRIRADRGLPVIPPQNALYDAMNNGLPPCAGAALGVERLLMCLLDANSIREVMAFPFDLA